MSEIKDLENELKLLVCSKGEELCKYCKLFVATDREHVIPKSWLEYSAELAELGFDIKVPKEIIVPSCRICNLLASDMLFSSFREKKNFIRSKMRKRFKRYMNAKIWTDEELLELDGNLRKQVFIFNEIAKLVKKRLK